MWRNNKESNWHAKLIHYANFILASSESGGSQLRICSEAGDASPWMLLQYLSYLI